MKPADVVYDPQEVTDLRKVVLHWKKSFIDPATLAAARTLLATPAAQPVALDRSELSKFFWGATTAVPDASLSGLDNVKVLARGMVQKAIDDGATLLALQTPIGTQNQETFHNYRKRCRSISNLLVGFPEVLRDAVAAAPTRKLLDTLVDRYGAVEDDLVARQLAADHHDTAQTAALEQRIGTEWPAAQAWQASVHLDDALRQLIADI